MAIQSTSAALAGMRPPVMLAKAFGTNSLVAGRMKSYWQAPGIPGAGALSTSLAGAALSGPLDGQIPRTNPAGGANAHLARLVMGSWLAGSVMVADRLWHNGGFSATATTAQTVNSVSLPARDKNGTTNGDGVFAAVEVGATMGSGTPNLTISYTNQAGVSGRTGVTLAAMGSASPIGDFYPVSLQAGDTGIRSIQTAQLSATWSSGTFNLVLYRPLAAIMIPGANQWNEGDALSLGMPRLFDDSVPFLVLSPSASNVAAGGLSGIYVETQG